MATRKEELQQVLQKITPEDIAKDLKRLTRNPEKLAAEVKRTIDKMSESDVERGVREKGGLQEFIESIIHMLALQATLVRYGLTVGVAAGAAAGIIYGAGNLCHSVGQAVGFTTLNDFGDGISTVGDIALSVSDTGFQVAEVGSGFFSDIIEGIKSIFC